MLTQTITHRRASIRRISAQTTPSPRANKMQSLGHKLDAAYLDPGKGTAVQDEGEVEVGLSEEDEGEEEAFSLTCPNPGCKFSIADETEEKRMANHRKVCEFQVSLVIKINSSPIKERDRAILC